MDVFEFEGNRDPPAHRPHGCELVERRRDRRSGHPLPERRLACDRVAEVCQVPDRGRIHGEPAIGNPQEPYIRLPDGLEVRRGDWPGLAARESHFVGEVHLDAVGVTTDDDDLKEHAFENLEGGDRLVLQNPTDSRHPGIQRAKERGRCIA